MAKKLTILELQNPEQLFGANCTSYAMFDASCEGQTITVGITHNALSRKGFDTSADALTRLIGCNLVTKDSVDSRTGEIVNTDERVDMVLDGTNRIVLLNSTNCNIEISDSYKTEQLELLATAKAKVQRDKERDALNAKRHAVLARLASRTPVADSDLSDDATASAPAKVAEPELTLDSE